MDTILTLIYSNYEENVIVNKDNAVDIQNIIKFDSDCMGSKIFKQGDYIFSGTISSSENKKLSKRADFLESKASKVYQLLRKMEKRSFDYSESSIERKRESLDKWEEKLFSHYESMTKYSFDKMTYDNCALFEDCNSGYYDYINK